MADPVGRPVPPLVIAAHPGEQPHSPALQFALDVPPPLADGDVPHGPSVVEPRSPIHRQDDDEPLATADVLDGTQVVE